MINTFSKHKTQSLENSTDNILYHGNKSKHETQKIDDANYNWKTSSLSKT